MKRFIMSLKKIGITFAMYFVESAQEKAKLKADLPPQEVPEGYNDLLRHLMHDHHFPYSRTDGDLRLIHRSQHASFSPKHRHAKPEKLDDSNEIARRQARLEKKQRRLDELNAEFEKLDDSKEIARRQAGLEKKQRRLDETRQRRLDELNAQFEELDNSKEIARRQAGLEKKQKRLDELNAELNKPKRTRD